MMTNFNLASTLLPERKSFLDIPDDHDFSLQNLPYGVFSHNGDSPRCGCAIGDFVLDLAAVFRSGWFAEEVPSVFDHPSLNKFAALKRELQISTRCTISSLLDRENALLRERSDRHSQFLIPVEDVELHLPFEIGDYTDFYSSKYHATNVGTMLRGRENALQENWLHLPVAYHGRASSVVLSGTDVGRPQGQLAAGRFGPSRALDYELEVGYYISQPSQLGQAVSIDSAHDHIFGLTIVNDWSARDIQRWEYVPLGPFLSKSFATSVAPWVVTLDALEPFAHPLPDQSPAPLPYLQGTADRTYDVRLTIDLETQDGVRHRIADTNYMNLYWSIAQQLAHHTVNGCNMRTGDLLASGTISGDTRDSRGCLLEQTWRGEEPLVLANGERRVFLEDGDTVIMRGWAQGAGYRIGFGEVRGTVVSHPGQRSET